MAYANSENQKAAQRRWYIANKEKVLERVKANRYKYKDKLFDLVRELKSQPCTDCKQVFHFSAMDFDHVSGDKSGNVARLCRSGSRAKLLAEIDKCELVCSNCHRLRTWQRMQVAVVELAYTMDSKSIASA